jgi:exodeoxyribonuclease V alpha subunit
VRAIRRYLASGLVRGIGPLLAQALTDRFGEQTLEVIEREPERLAEVYGIGRRRSRWIVESWHAQAEIRELMGAAARLRHQPAAGRAAAPGLRLRRARDAHPLPVPAGRRGGRDQLRHRGPHRHRRGPAAQRRGAARGGRLGGVRRGGAALRHCHLPAAQIVGEAAHLAEQPAELLRAALDRLGTGKASPIILESHPVTGVEIASVRAANRAERKLAKDLAALAAAPSDLPRGVRRLVEEDGFGADLAEGQREAVRMALTNTVSVLTGGPGCGKSHTVRELVRLVRAGGGSVTLAAPTGKAARRLAELTGAEAMTVHRLAADPHPGDDPARPGGAGPRTATAAARCSARRPRWST